MSGTPFARTMRSSTPRCSPSARLGDHALVRGAARQPIELARRDARDGDALVFGEPEKRGESIVAARRDADRRHAPGAQALENRINPVDPHAEQTLHHGGTRRNSFT